VAAISGLMDAAVSASVPQDQVDATDAQQTKDKKKKNIAKDMKEKTLSMLRWHGDTSPSAGKEPKVSSSSQSRDSKPVKPTADSVVAWSKSLDNLLSDRCGLDLFRDFLRSEYSDENLEFWIACEEYRTLRDDKVVAQAQKIFTDFVAIQAPREINLDSKTREETAAKMASPNRTTFELAQKRIVALMAKDSYPRFLRSDVYRNQLALFKVQVNLAALSTKTT